MKDYLTLHQYVYCNEDFFDWNDVAGPLLKSDFHETKKNQISFDN